MRIQNFKAYFIVCISTLLFTQFSFAQQYKTAAGVRLGQDIGLTVQQYIGNKMTVEGLLTSAKYTETVNVSAILEKHLNLLSRRINVYAGVGPHFGFKNTNKIGYDNVIGASFVLGGELTMKNLNFSLDYKPTLNISKGDLQPKSNPYWGLSIRYVLVKRETFIDNIKKKIKRKH